MVCHWRTLTALALLATAASVLAFNGHLIKEGPLTLAIAEIPVVTELDRPTPVTVNLTNSGAERLELALQLTGLVDETRADGPATVSLTLAPSGTAVTNFQFVMGRGSHSALYPLHVVATFQHGSEPRVAHAIRIYETRFPATLPMAAPTMAVLKPNGILALGSLAPEVTVRVKTPVRLKPGFRGSDPETGGSFEQGQIDRGAIRQALVVHPPYKTGAGTLFLDYRLRLPAPGPVSLQFYNAIRDHTPAEPPSDGVTFRVFAEGEQVFSRHTSAKIWEAGAADLSRWAGRKITLRLESHPGPKMNTVCDSGYWGGPVVVSGETPQAQTPTEQAAQRERARAALSGSNTADATVFELGAGLRAAIVPGRFGLADAALAFGSGGTNVVLEGFRLVLRDQVVGDVPAGPRVLGVEARVAPNGRHQWRHRIALAGEPGGEASAPTSLLAEVWAEDGALRVRLSSPERITDLAPGRGDQPPARVYYGHGYVIDQPGAFHAHGGGHDLSSSHVAAEYGSGLSLLVACDTPPDELHVNAAERIFALHTHPDSTFTFVPGVRGGLETAGRFRSLSEKRAAPSVEKKAGRFVFDLWGGRYTDDAALLRRCFAYGLTNSLAIMHVWQRWGYDYRLPDIFPPLPSLGTLEDLRQLSQDCAAAGVLWGLHDNYIDFYPDADGFSYENISFHQDGRPCEGWLNEGRDAQAYQFRPDKLAPFLERNLKLIAPALRPTTSFVDVWTSLNAFDYYDRHGGWHSKLETLRAWGGGFASIRTALGGAPTISEAGSDQLIGWVDGADAQFMRISDSGELFCKHVPCADSERVPWLDLAHHRRFSLHGVGYSSRYEGGLSRELHGIVSDDYLSAEILTGHALMMDLPGLTRGAVRKYWLAQEFIESIALDDLVAVEFAGGNLHRLKTRWSSGAEAWVNRGETDWIVEGRTLPRFGYLARNGKIESSVEKIGGRVVEQSSSSRTRYCNARGAEPDAPLPIVPESVGVEHLGGGKFRLRTKWTASGPAPRDLQVFYHFKKRAPGRYTEQAFYSGGAPEVPTSRWRGVYQLGGNWTAEVPADFPPGEYQILVGLFDPKGNGRRYRLQGDERAGGRYFLGKIVVEGKTGSITDIRFVPPTPGSSMERPADASGSETDFAWLRTSGGLRVLTADKAVTFLPLPDGPEFEINVVIQKIFPDTENTKLQTIDAAGNIIGQQSGERDGAYLRWRTQSGVFGYRLGPIPAK